MTQSYILARRSKYDDFLFGRAARQRRSMVRAGARKAESRKARRTSTTRGSTPQSATASLARGTPSLRLTRVAADDQNFDSEEQADDDD
jgi:hypothetical protein